VKYKEQGVNIDVTPDQATIKYLMKWVYEEMKKKLEEVEDNTNNKQK
jgi:hypothetical protein